MAKTNYNKPSRNPSRVLEENDLKVLYEDVLLFVENDIFDSLSFGKFDDLKKKISQHETLKGFRFEYEDYLNKMQTPVNDTFYFDAEKEIESKSKRKTSKIAKKFFSHVRNAFAHNYVKYDDGGHLILASYQEHSYKPQFYAQLSSVCTFKSLLDYIKETIQLLNKTENETHQ